MKKIWGAYAKITIMYGKFNQNWYNANIANNYLSIIKKVVALFFFIK